MLQIATIGLAASTDVIGVCLGGILGHAICTGAAVIGGRQLSSHIDERMLSILGGLLFIAFGLHAAWEVPPPTHVLCELSLQSHLCNKDASYRSNLLHEAATLWHTAHGVCRVCQPKSR